MNPSNLLSLFVVLFVMAPVLAAFMAFTGPLLVRPLARTVLLCSWLANTAATVVCLRYAFAKPSSGIGNQVLLLPAILIGIFSFIWFGVWRGARRHAYVQSLPPAERRVEELADIERALEAATKNLASAERRLKGWMISSDERERLEFEVGLLIQSIRKLEEERAKRL